MKMRGVIFRGRLPGTLHHHRRMILQLAVTTSIEYNGKLATSNPTRGTQSY